jgi:hypothetical protein
LATIINKEPLDTLDQMHELPAFNMGQSPLRQTLLGPLVTLSFRSDVHDAYA